MDISEIEFEFTEEFEGYEGIVGICSGDLYENGAAFGYYIAAIYPDERADLELLVSVVDEESNCILSIGVKCAIGNAENLIAVDPNELPWDEDGVMHCAFVKPSEYSNHSRATQAFDAANFIILNDKNIRTYIQHKYV